MTWNYRILQYTSGEMGIHEVYYDKDGNPESCTAEAVGIVGETLSELKAELGHFSEAFNKPILAYESFGKKEGLNE